jgi:hypothetical protein
VKSISFGSRPERQERDLHTETFAYLFFLLSFLSTQTAEIMNVLNFWGSFQQLSTWVETAGKRKSFTEGFFEQGFNT